MMEVFELGGMAAAVVAAYQSHLLQALLNGSATPARYAEELGLDATATERLLDVLAQVGVADCEHGSYAASTALSQLDAQLLGGLDAIGALWSQVPAFLVHGERLALMDGPPAVREAAYSPIVSGLAELFVEAARQLAATLAGSPAQILDVGAGSGIWSLAMAEHHPHARVTALDLPGVLPAFRLQAEHLGLVGRTLTLAGDFHHVELPPQRFDRVVLANVLHLEPPAQAAALICRVASSLVRGGDLVIVEMLGDGTAAGERARAIYALHLALRTRQGQVHPLSELQAWVEQAGLLPGEVIQLHTPPGMAALVARAPLEKASTKDRSEEE
jgi:2-polyprenyl-3-methyl-5-hydroxy-6-metoxy-1,4-benzoquinol methylase